MTSIPDVAEAMRTVLILTPDAAARPTGFVQRASKLTGPLFVQTTVLGWLQHPDATLDGLTQTAAALGVVISPQGLDQRFTPQASALLQEVLHAAVTQSIAADPVAIPLLQRFTAVLLQDSSTIALPDALATVWQGCGGRPGPGRAALKLQVRVDLCTGALTGPLLEDGRRHDRASALQAAPVPRGALHLADLGYFSLERLHTLHQAGAFFLSRLHPQTAVYDEQGERLDLARWLQAAAGEPVDQPVYLGATHRLPVRLLAVRVPQEVADERRRRLHAEARRRGQTVSQRSVALADWTIVVTNVPVEQMSLEEALVLLRVRWQIELLFKLWKQHGQIDEWRSAKPWRILCEVYAKLIGLLIQHWLFLVGCWVHPERSLVKAAATVQSAVPLLVVAIVEVVDLTVAIAHIGRGLDAGCRMNRRRKKPNTYQLLLNPEQVA